MDFTVFGDQKVAERKYWESQLVVPDRECFFTLPAGTMLWIHWDEKKPGYEKDFCALINPIRCHIDPRGSTNYDNQRWCKSDEGHYFHIKARRDTPDYDYLKKNYPEVYAMVVEPILEEK